MRIKHFIIPPLKPNGLWSFVETTSRLTFDKVVENNLYEVLYQNFDMNIILNRAKAEGMGKVKIVGMGSVYLIWKKWF